jgi:hypothetical protein
MGILSWSLVQVGKHAGRLTFPSAYRGRASFVKEAENTQASLLLMDLQRSGRGGTLVREGSYLSLELDRTV